MERVYRLLQNEKHNSKQTYEKCNSKNVKQTRIRNGDYRMNIHEIGGTGQMAHAHAKLIQQGGSRMPRKEEACDLSCQFGFACRNFNKNGICRGFQLLNNGQLERHIQKNVLECCEECLKNPTCDSQCENRKVNDFEHHAIQNYIRMIQVSDAPEIRQDLATTVLRFLRIPPKHEKRRTMRGFTEYEINEDNTLSLPESKSSKQTPIQEPLPESMVMLLHNDQERMKKKKE